MTDLPILLYTSTWEILTFFIPEALKRYPFRAEPPRIGHYREHHPVAILSVSHQLGCLSLFCLVDIFSVSFSCMPVN